MEDDVPPPGKEYPLSPASLSKTPSWVMLGFVLGALCVYSLPPSGPKTPPAAEPAADLAPPRPAGPRVPQPFTTIEAVFAEWGRHAVWSDDTTEVVLWNSRDRDFTDCYEVRRFGDTHYFRTIPGLTRRLINHGAPLPESPLRFTETEEQYREWLEHGRTERTAERSFRPTTTSSPPPRPTVRMAPVAGIPPELPGNPPIAVPSKGEK
ncbi:MAG: hypothetical protein EXS37_01215 [Opitutus sp.]|nr:hypothetical protein [Opitutus sp.]